MLCSLFCIYFDHLFFGLILVIFGVTLILKTIFKFTIPLWPLFGGIMLIYGGLSLLTQTITKASTKNCHFLNKTIQ